MNGYLVEGDVLSELGDKLTELMEDKRKRVAFSENALIGAEKFQLEMVIKCWNKLLEIIVK